MFAQDHLAERRLFPDPGLREGESSDTEVVGKKEGNVKWLCVFAIDLEYSNSPKITHLLTLISIKRKLGLFLFLLPENWVMFHESCKTV